MSSPDFPTPGVIPVDQYDAYGISIKPDLRGEDPEEAATYDLHISKYYKKLGDDHPYRLKKGHAILPGQCLRVVTEETVSLGPMVFGQICARASLSREGFMVPATKVDPNFADQLDITIFNTRGRPLYISPGEAFCSIFFQTLTDPIYTKTITRPKPHVRKSTWLRDALTMMKAPAHIVVFTLSVAASILAGIILLLMFGQGGGGR